MIPFEPKSEGSLFLLSLSKENKHRIGIFTKKGSLCSCGSTLTDRPNFDLSVIKWHTNFHKAIFKSIFLGFQNTKHDHDLIFYLMSNYIQEKLNSTKMYSLFDSIWRAWWTLHIFPLNVIFFNELQIATLATKVQSNFVDNLAKMIWRSDPAVGVR